MHLLSLLSATKPAGNHESIGLIIIAILVAIILFTLSSRLNNLDKMIKMLNEKVINLEKVVTKLQTLMNKPKEHNNSISINKNLLVNGPFTEDNIEDPENLIDHTPKISKLLDPRIKPKDINKENKE